MKPNIKGKIIIGVTLAFVGGTTIWLIVNRLRKRRIMNDIMGQLKDVTSEEGQQAIIQEENQIKGSNAFDTTFWKKTTGSPLPNANLLMRPMDARDMAKRFRDNMMVFNHTNGHGGWADDEGNLLGLVKSVKSKGQMSQIADAYQNSICCKFGNLADDLVESFNDWWDNQDDMKLLNNHVKNLPN